ncbi:MAG: hypothetical protein AB7R77_12575 [Ilumatobacteraceae bacterium]
MALSEPELVALVQRFETRLDAYRSAGSDLLEGAWDALAGYDEADLAEFLRRVTPRLYTLLESTVEISSAFYRSTLALPTAAVPKASVVPKLGLNQAFHATWHALAQGRSFEDAVAAGRSMASARAFDLVQSTSRRAGDATVAVSRARIVGWRRVVSANSCPWCHTVAGQIYRTSVSADFGHDRCDCTAIPITGTIDPGRALNRQRIGDSSEGV